MTTMTKPSKAAKPPRGKFVVVMTPDERIADMQEFGREIRESKKLRRHFSCERVFSTRKVSWPNPIVANVYSLIHLRIPAQLHFGLSRV